jgi:hypothetical protein
MTKGLAMRRLMLFGMLLVAAAAGCHSLDKDVPVGAAEPSYYQLPKIYTATNWWQKGEMGDIEIDK